MQCLLHADQGIPEHRSHQNDRYKYLELVDPSDPDSETKPIIKTKDIGLFFGAKTQQNDNNSDDPSILISSSNDSAISSNHNQCQLSLGSNEPPLRQQSIDSIFERINNEQLSYDQK